MSQKTLVLASASPRRAELLDQIRMPFSVFPVHLDESIRPGETPDSLARRLAMEKARAAKALYPDACRGENALYFLGADTFGVLDGDYLVKPRDYTHYRAMMARMSGRTHQIYSSVALVGETFAEVRLTVSSVRFRPLSVVEMDAYWSSGEPADKAGGYAIQGRGALFVQSLEGSYSGVVGLPLMETAELLTQAGFDVWRSEQEKE